MKSNFSCGERLRELRFKGGLSQEELALRADLSTAYIGMIERGLKNPTVRIVEQLCQALGLTLFDFFYPSRRDSTLENALTDKLHRLSPAEQETLLSLIDQIISFKLGQH